MDRWAPLQCLVDFVHNHHDTIEIINVVEHPDKVCGIAVRELLIQIFCSKLDCKFVDHDGRISHGHNFADLHYALAAVIFALIGHKFRCGRGKGGVELQHRFEVKMADG